MMIPKLIAAGFFSEGAFNRLFEIVNSALDRLFQRAFLMRNDNRFAALAARLDHAAFVFMASLFAYGIAKVHVDPPETVAVAVQCSMDHRFHPAENCSLPLMLPSVLTSISIVVSVVTSRGRCRAI